MDIRIKTFLQQEEERQRNNIELIASENYASDAVRELQGSILTNKYAEGYPGKRYYGGCQHIDSIENLAIEYACQLFACKYANVQPHSGSSANMAVYRALLQQGDTVLGMNLNEGGHLTHGHALSFSGQDYNIISYGIDENGYIDYDALEEIINKQHPKMVIAGASAYPREIDFQKIRSIIDNYNKNLYDSIDATYRRGNADCYEDEQGQKYSFDEIINIEYNKSKCYLMVDMAHIAGLVATGLHQSPIPYADVVTSTTHKTLRGPRGGLILTNDEELIKKINRTVFPGIQGGPLEHVIAAKAQCFYEALQPEFKEYQIQVLKNIQALAHTLQDRGLHIISGGTDNHLILVDVYNTLGITGKEAETLLDLVNITVNKNAIPNDQLKPQLASGLRLGSPAMTTRGLKEEDFTEIGNIIYDTLTSDKSEEELAKQKARVLTLTTKCK